MVPKKSLPRWLFVPPAVALLLLLGPLSMQGGGTPASAAAQEPPAAPADAGRGLRAPSAPRTPELWSVGSALVGVLLLGAGGVMLLKKLRGGATPTRGAQLATLRQTLRLSARQAIHAIEFDDRILLVGEHERGLVLLERGGLPDAGHDEATLAARHAAAAAAEDADGAVPKDLVIPRPDRAAPRATPAARTPGLGDFRALLQRAGRA